MILRFILYNRKRPSQYFKFYGEYWRRDGVLMARVTPFRYGTEGLTLASRWIKAEDLMVLQWEEQ